MSRWADGSGEGRICLLVLVRGEQSLAARDDGRLKEITQCY